MSEGRGDEEGRPAPQGEPEQGAEALGRALGGAARRAGLDPAGGGTAAHAMWRSMGGWRGIVESVLPGLAFVVLFTLWPEPLVLSLGVSVGIAAVFTVLRLVAKSPPSAAIGGLVAAAAAAALALWTGRGEDNFVPGLITNGVYGTAILVSALVGWPLIGIIAGYLMGEGVAWRGDRRKRRVLFWITLAWAALFFVRLAVQLPLYLAGNVTALGALKLVMGIPLFAPLVALTWLVVRSLYPRRSPDDTGA